MEDFFLWKKITDLRSEWSLNLSHLHLLLFLRFLNSIHIFFQYTTTEFKKCAFLQYFQSKLTFIGFRSCTQQYQILEIVFILVKKAERGYNNKN